MARLFGTDGVRGIANRELTCDLAYRIGYAGAQVLTDGAHKPLILVGTDSRISGDMLSCALQAGICSMGARVEHVGVLPTPGIAYLTRTAGADAGVVISASHNSFEYNGIKWFSGNGFKLSDALEDDIEAVVNEPAKRVELPVGAGVGRRSDNESLRSVYTDHLIEQGEDLSGMKLVLDCANGAASAAAPAVFNSLGADVTACFNQPDGVNINAGCGSTKPQQLQALVRACGADAGLAFDGDADRLIAVDEKGALVDGDRIMAACALDMHRRGALKKDALVVTVMSNLGMKLAMRAAGIATVETPVGDRYVMERMLQDGYNFGGEQSGHMVFLDIGTTGDGILSGIQLLNIMARSGQKLSALASAVEIYPQVLLNVEVGNDKKHGVMDDARVRGRIAEAEEKLKGKGRVLVRVSGTEPLLRVMLEGPEQPAIEDEATAIAALIADMFDGRIK